MVAYKSPAVAIVRAVALLILVCTAARVTWSGEKKKASVSPDPKIQKLLRTVANAKEEQQCDKEVCMATITLERMSRESPELLGPQLVYFSAHANETEWIGMALLARRLMLEGGLREPIIPLLESDDKKIREEAENYLRGLDSAQTAGRDQSDPEQSSVGFYAKVLLAQKNSPPPGLVAYLYRQSPGQAMVLFGAIYLAKPAFAEYPRGLIWSQHLVSTVMWRQRKRFLQEGDLDKALKEIEKLSKHEGWYVRRYVVEMLRDDRGYGTPEMIERLKKDAHPLVREPAQLIGKPRIPSFR